MTNDDLFYYTGTAGLIDGDRLYTVDTETTYLLEFDLKDFSHRVLSYDALWDEDRIRMVMDIFKVGEELIFTMLFCSNVLIYNLKDGTHIEYGDGVQNFSGPQNVRSYMHDGRIYIFPERIGSQITVFDTEKKEFVDPITLPVDREARDVEFMHLNTSGSSIWFGAYDSSYIYTYNLDTHKYERFDVGNKYWLDGFFMTGQEMYLTLRGETALYRWSPADGLGDRYDITTMTLTKGHQWISDILSTENGLLCVSRYRDCGFIFDTESGRETAVIFPEGCRRIRNVRSTIFKCELRYGDDILIIPNTMNMMVRINPATARTTAINTRMHVDDIKKYCARRLAGVPETGAFDLEDFLIEECTDYYKEN